MNQRVADDEFRVGRRGSYSYTDRGTLNFGFGDITTVNKRTVVVVDRKFPGEQRVTVDKALFYSVFDL